MYSEYTKAVAELNNYDELVEQTEVYNKNLINNADRFYTERENLEYKELMSIQFGGIMGYVTAYAAGISSVPVYHYTTTESLQAGAGHFAGSSLPSYQKGVHTVISGHSGMSGMKMFSQLTKMKVGDKFELKYLDKELVYEVDGIFTVSPDDVSRLGIYENANYCSLITCTPIGLNTHRLIVRGILREVNDINSNKITVNKSSDNTRSLNNLAAYELVMSGISVFLIGIFISDNKKYSIKRRNADENKKNS